MTKWPSRITDSTWVSREYSRLIWPQRAISRYTGSSNICSAVRGIIQNLNLQKVLRIPHIAGRLDQPFYNIHFVVNRKLYRHPGLHFQLRRRLRNLVLVFQVEVDEM